MDWSLLTPLILATLLLGYLARRRRNLPPGPPKLPFLGNALQMPAERQWVTFTQWGQEYGEIVGLSVFGSSIIILNSRKVITELFDKRGAIYSNRPSLPMAGELMGYEQSVVLAGYGPHHRECRKLLLSSLSERKVTTVQDLQERKVVNFVSWLHKNPENLSEHIRRLVATIILKLTHGHDVPEEGNDPIIDLVEKANHEFSIASAPGAYLVDTIPLMKVIPAWFPGAQWKRSALAYRKTMAELRDAPFEDVKEQVKRGIAEPSFTERIIRNNPNPSHAEDLVQRWTSVAFYSAGSDTTVSAIRSFFLSMALFPEIQKRAQDEIDQVVGKDRLPSFKDRPELSYVEKVIKEVFRWNPVAPLAIPHQLTRDDVYEGYVLPKGAVVFANSWGLMHDPTVYPSPFDFNPDRYDTVDSEGLINPDPRNFAFGYGRRVCPGEAMADSTLYITAVITLSLFNLSNPVDGQGKPVLGSTFPYTPGLITHPEPFGCSITLRSPECLSRIRESES